MLKMFITNMLAALPAFPTSLKDFLSSEYLFVACGLAALLVILFCIIACVQVEKKDSKKALEAKSDNEEIVVDTVAEEQNTTEEVPQEAEKIEAPVVKTETKQAEKVADMPIYVEEVATEVKEEPKQTKAVVEPVKEESVAEKVEEPAKEEEFSELVIDDEFTPVAEEPVVIENKEDEIIVEEPVAEEKNEVVSSFDAKEENTDSTSFLSLFDDDDSTASEKPADEEKPAKKEIVKEEAKPTKKATAKKPVADKTATAEKKETKKSDTATAATPKTTKKVEKKEEKKETVKPVVAEKVVEEVKPVEIKEEAVATEENKPAKSATRKPTLSKEAQKKAALEQKAAEEAKPVAPKKIKIGKEGAWIFRHFVEQNYYTFELVANNGKVLYSSRRPYATIAACRMGMRTFMKYVATTEPVYTKDRNGNYTFTLRGGSNNYVGEPCSSETICKSNFKSVMNFAETAIIQEEIVENE